MKTFIILLLLLCFNISVSYAIETHYKKVVTVEWEDSNMEYITYEIQVCGVIDREKIYFKKIVTEKSATIHISITGRFIIRVRAINEPAMYGEFSDWCYSDVEEDCNEGVTFEIKTRSNSSSNLF